MVKRNQVKYRLAVSKGYSVTKSGEIISPRGISRKLSSNRGYLGFTIKDAGKTIHVKVHRLIAFFKFGESIFDEDLQVRHLDGNSKNNNWDNIAIGTAFQNAMDKKPEIRRQAAIKASSSIVRDDWERIDQDRERGMSFRKLATKYSISKGALSYRYSTKAKRRRRKDSGL